jgi:hypothetical protein
MDGDEAVRGRVAAAAWSLAVLDAPEVDEFDLDLRLGELTTRGHLHWLGTPLGAQTDPQCELPTGGKGAGTTCNTNDPTCHATCDGLGTCPQTQCGNTCANTCHTCATECGQHTCACTDAGCHTDVGNTCVRNAAGRMICQPQ